MFCGECGTKNKKGAAFCEECGAKLEVEEKEEKKSSSKESKEEVKKEVKEKKPLTKKQKTLCIIGVIALVVLFGGYKYLEKQTSPKTIVENYLKAVNANDYKKLYKYSNYEGDKTFITEKQFEEAMKEQNKDAKAGNYVVGNVTLENAGLEANVTVNTTEKKELSIRLTKGMKKKYLFFDNWTITDASAFGLKTVEKYKIKVPEGTEVTFAGVKVADKYQGKKDKDSTSKLVEYELPQVFATKTKMSVKYANSTKDIDTTPSSYNNSYTVTFDEEDFNKDDTKKLYDKSKTIIQALMTGIKDGKDYKDIKEASNLDKSTKDVYDKKASSYSRYNRKLEAFEITDGEIRDISTDDGYIKVRLSVSYKYSTDQLKDRTTSSTVYVYLSYDKDFEVNKVTTLPYAGVY